MIIYHCHSFQHHIYRYVKLLISHFHISNTDLEPHTLSFNFLFLFETGNRQTANNIVSKITKMMTPY